MSAAEALENGHQSVLTALNDLPESEWEIPGADGDWSIKDIVAHLAAYDLVIIDILKTFHDSQPGPYVLKLFRPDGKVNSQEFNQETVATRRYHTAQQVLNEFQEGQLQVTSLLQQFSPASLQQPGTLPWFKTEISLEELLNKLARHLQEHGEQIQRFHHRHDLVE
ncbi:DinB family protein [Tengunoibacter tsumagoiensis]|uniref:DinB-like domain-containing protein n=1 Tax=Tengunoibacter tsumagoiensis TaxID=2014871 RepID=A0A402A3F8_9CHLR|nr:DinB family protein [Tengunoibacter tsumagoiensis]GCE13683.1 hypothetical protein KTT_35420 [Tengunoibacter tsumagoiensis]